jgi:glycosyltransferase involved in cell wall biosynthesis
MKSPDISVIVPHLNQGELLERCLASLEQQTIKNVAVEIIVVDNGSTTLPVDVINKFSGVRLERENEPGPGLARNKGISTSTADILAFIDADCIADRSWLETIRKTFIDRPKIHVIGGDVQIALTNAAKVSMIEAYESVYAYRQQQYIEEMGFSGTGNLAMRRRAYDEVGPFKGIEIAEDRDWGRRATAMGFPAKYIPEMIVFHPARPSFSDLYVKWDRHIQHDYVELSVGVVDRLKWIAKATALFVSPALELPRIAHSDRLMTGWARCLAFVGLIRVRFYRGRRMLSMIVSPKSSKGSAQWNREE